GGFETKKSYRNCTKSAVPGVRLLLVNGGLEVLLEGGLDSRVTGAANVRLKKLYPHRGKLRRGGRHSACRASAARLTHSFPSSFAKHKFDRNAPIAYHRFAQHNRWIDLNALGHSPSSTRL